MVQVQLAVCKKQRASLHVFQLSVLVFFQVPKRCTSASTPSTPCGLGMVAVDGVALLTFLGAVGSAASLVLRIGREATALSPVHSSSAQPGQSEAVSTFMRLPVKLRASAACCFQGTERGQNQEVRHWHCAACMMSMP